MAPACSVPRHGRHPRAMSSAVVSAAIEPILQVKPEPSWPPEPREPSSDETPPPPVGPRIDEIPPSAPFVDSEVKPEVCEGSGNTAGDPCKSDEPDDNGNDDRASDSDYVLDGEPEDEADASSGDAWSGESSESESESDWSSGYGARRASKARRGKGSRGKKRGRKRDHPRPDNDMTRKLRSRAQADGEDSSSNYTEGKVELEDSVDDAPGV